MKQKQIFLILGVIALVLVIFNWNKIFGKGILRGGGVAEAPIKLCSEWCWNIHTQKYWCCGNILGGTGPLG